MVAARPTGLNGRVNVALSLVALVAAVLALSGASSRLGLPAPLVLIAAGVIGSFLPFVPEVHLSAEVVLVGLLPPLLYSAALQSSLVDFTHNRASILALSVGLVAFTTVGVGVVVHLVLPEVGWAPAFALGAVVAPPDAVAATAIGRRIGLPRQIVTLLEGESLLNDATALVALRTALAAAAGAVSVLQVGVDFLVAAVVGIGVGLVCYLVIGWVRRRFTEAVFDSSISLITPFLAYVVAEELHGSGVLAVVVAGLLLGHRAPVLQTASSRIAERLNWRTISFLLENAVFLLIGLQASRILTDAADSGLGPGRVAWICLATFLAVVLLRLVWVFPVRALLAMLPTRHPDGESTWREAAIVGWAGMRGVVTLAAAFAIPADVEQHSLLVLVAFAVTGGTLFLHGTTLPAVARLLRMRPPDAREDALARAALFQKASAAGMQRLAELDADEDRDDVQEALRRRAEQRDFAAWERLGDNSPEAETPSEAYARLRLEMLQAERERVLEVRDTGKVPAEVVADVLTSLDVEESMLDIRERRREPLRAAQQPTGAQLRTRPPACLHLEQAPRDVEPTVEDACEDCLVEGTRWVHLRRCLTCGHMGCCDSSPGRHASRHFEATGHPVMRSAEPDEDWRWCFVDHRLG